MKSLDFLTLVGKTFLAIEQRELDWDNKPAEVWFVSKEETFKLYHAQACCEQVYLADIVGNFEDLINTPILMAYEASKHEQVTDQCRLSDIFTESVTWTFYHLATIKGFVTLRWFGESNGYYSERVDLGQIV